MSNTMSLSPTGLLAVDCVGCRRRVRVSDTADAPHMSVLRSLGWVLTAAGRWQCDECTLHATREEPVGFQSPPYQAHGSFTAGNDGWAYIAAEGPAADDECAGDGAQRDESGPHTMSLAPTGLLAVDCMTCGRRVRVADYGDYPLSRAMADLGWQLTDQGKWQCDECTGGPAPSLTPEQAARVDRILGGKLSPQDVRDCQAEAYDLETVQRVESLGKRLWEDKDISDEAAQMLGLLVMLLCSKVHTRALEGR